MMGCSARTMLKITASLSCLLGLLSVQQLQLQPSEIHHQVPPLPPRLRRINPNPAIQFRLLFLKRKHPRNLPNHRPLLPLPFPFISGFLNLRNRQFPRLPHNLNRHLLTILIILPKKPPRTPIRPGILPHRPNHLLPLQKHNPGFNPFGRSVGERDYQDEPALLVFFGEDDGEGYAEAVEFGQRDQF
ncbi:hypothetical protein BJX70DRAFT_10179 [Aspergillus crustosus]